MPIYKRCATCGKRMQEGVYCNCHSKRYKMEDKHKKDTKEKNFYSSGEWETARLRAINRCNSIDLYSYYILDILEYGQTVHHIIPLKECWDKKVDLSNLFYMTNSNHQLIHKMLDTNKKEIINLLHSLNERYFSKNR